VNLSINLILSNKFEINKSVSNMGKVIYHDSCYLGRHNDIYDAPRNVLESVIREKPVEMDKNRKHSFCCGAGGGRMWMEENLGKRMNLERVSEAICKNPDTISVACPYCLTMFEDGLKDMKNDKIMVKDIAEVLAEALRDDN